MFNVTTYDEILGKSPKTIIVDEEENIIDFLFDDCSMRFYSIQDKDEVVVEIDEIVGNIQDLIGKPLLMAEEVQKQGEYNFLRAVHNVAKYAWTFHKFATIEGYVTVKWYGESYGDEPCTIYCDYRVEKNEFPITCKKTKGVTVYQ